MFILWDRDQNHHGNTENDTNSKFQESTHFDFKSQLLFWMQSFFFAFIPLDSTHVHVYLEANFLWEDCTCTAPG